MIFSFFTHYHFLSALFIAYVNKTQDRCFKSVLALLNSCRMAHSTDLQYESRSIPVGIFRNLRSSPAGSICYSLLFLPFIYVVVRTKRFQTFGFLCHLRWSHSNFPATLFWNKAVSLPLSPGDGFPKIQAHHCTQKTAFILKESCPTIY